MSVTAYVVGAVHDPYDDITSWPVRIFRSYKRAEEYTFELNTRATQLNIALERLNYAAYKRMARGQRVPPEEEAAYAVALAKTTTALPEYQALQELDPNVFIGELHHHGYLNAPKYELSEAPFTEE